MDAIYKVLGFLTFWVWVVSLLASCNDLSKKGVDTRVTSIYIAPTVNDGSTNERNV